LICSRQATRPLDTLSPDFEQLPDPKAADYGALVTRWLAGTYAAAWDRLKEAVYSATVAAAHGVSTAYDTWERIRQRQAHPAELDFLTDMNHMSAVHGPALGAVISAAFAVESFLRLGYAVALDLPRPRNQRAGGLNELLRKQLEEFDSAKLRDRFGILRGVAAFTYSKSREAALLDLIQYRNEIAHDSPVLHLSSGQRLAVFRHRPRRGSVFEPLVASHRPVRLKHTIAAIRAHDDFVLDATKSAQLSGWANEMDRLGGPYLCISEYLPWLAMVATGS